MDRSTIVRVFVNVDTRFGTLWTIPFVHGETTSLDTPEASFITMLMDRLQALEADNDRLRADLDARSPAITLLVHSGFNVFSDGWSLSWEMLKDPTMKHEFAERILAKTAERSLFPGTQLEVPLDDAHWNAVAFPCATTVELRDKDVVIASVRIGQSDSRVTVRMLVTELHDHLRRPIGPDSTRTYADSLLHAKILEETGVMGNPGPDDHPYYGVFKGFTPAYIYRGGDLGDMILWLKY